MNDINKFRQICRECKLYFNEGAKLNICRECSNKNDNIMMVNREHLVPLRKEIYIKNHTDLNGFCPANSINYIDTNINLELNIYNYTDLNNNKHIVYQTPWMNYEYYNENVPVYYTSKKAYENLFKNYENIINQFNKKIINYN